jgi:uncharacterized membrane protein
VTIFDRIYYNQKMTDIEPDNDKVKSIEREPLKPMPAVNALSFDDLNVCLREGISDFLKAPLFGLFFGAVFAIGGLFIVQSMFVWQKVWMIYPVIIGFPLIGPFAAVGLYEVSRRLENDLPLEWGAILHIIWQQIGRELKWMGFVMLFIFWVWMYQVRLLLALILGHMSFPSWDKFFQIITTTTEGWIFILVGHLVGALLSLFLFSVTVVSIPLLLERDEDFITAMITSVKTVFASPFVMLSWGIFVTVAVLASFIPAFLGLLVVLPVLGHTTWHIYKKAVV